MTSAPPRGQHCRPPRTPRRHDRERDQGRPGGGGVTKLTLTHEVDGAPLAAGITSGAVSEAGGGLPWVLSDLKTLLETGEALPGQMGG